MNTIDEMLNLYRSDVSNCLNKASQQSVIDATQRWLNSKSIADSVRLSKLSDAISRSPIDASDNAKRKIEDNGMMPEEAAGYLADLIAGFEAISRACRTDISKLKEAIGRLSELTDAHRDDDSTLNEREQEEAVKCINELLEMLNDDDERSKTREKALKRYLGEK